MGGFMLPARGQRGPARDPQGQGAGAGDVERSWSIPAPRRAEGPSPGSPHGITIRGPRGSPPPCPAPHLQVLVRSVFGLCLLKHQGLLGAAGAGVGFAGLADGHGVPGTPLERLAVQRHGHAGTGQALAFPAAL